MCFKTVFLWFLIITVNNKIVQSSETCSNYDTSICPLNGENPNYRNLRSADLIRLFGYPVEEHRVITEDGYILTLQRIPYSKVSTNRTGKIPVFCMHGIFMSSAQWFWQPANRALVFMLADVGYDVWIGNSRGTSYSQGHVNLTTSNIKYWDFSSFEMGKYDIKAVIEYILEETLQPSLYYIGHSLGGQQFFIAMTLHPELNSKIRTMFALAPAVYTGNTTNLVFKATAPVYGPYFSYRSINMASRGKFTPSVLAKFMNVGSSYCSYSLINCALCSSVYFSLSGYDPYQANYTTLPGFFAHFPDVISVKTFSHSAQAINSGLFAQYDYGASKNMRVYGKRIPQEYDWTKLNVPVVLYYGANDKLVPPQDMHKLAGKLGANLKEINEVPYPCWNHLDHILGKDADIYLYNPIIKIMNNRSYG